jgi:hypothetical protein
MEVYYNHQYIRFMIASLSDWAWRGWVAQEMSTAKNIKLLNKNSFDDATCYIKKFRGKIFGVILEKYDDTRKLQMLNRRDWRYYDDIAITSKW